MLPNDSEAVRRFATGAAEPVFGIFDPEFASGPPILPGKRPFLSLGYFVDMLWTCQFRWAALCC